MSTEPTITVAIPLHGSAEWIDNVVDNVRALPRTVTDIVISDRTCLDDAAQRLRVELVDDPRVTVRASPDGLGFPEHYQLLLDESDSELFMWMPHDDVFEPSWIPVLAGALAAHPQAWLAYGRLQVVEHDGVTPHGSWPRRRPPGQFGDWEALSMALVLEMGLPFRGVFRRANVLSAGIMLTDRWGEQLADQAWCLSVAIRSQLIYDDRTCTRKRIYPTSTSASWKPRTGDVGKMVLGVLQEHGPQGLEGTTMRWRTRWALGVAHTRRARRAIRRASTAALAAMRA